MAKIGECPSISAKGQAETNVYDPVNRLTRNIHRLGGLTDYQYDENDRLTQVNAPNGVVTTFSYDPLGRVVSEISADRGTLTYTYEPADNLTAMIDARGVQVRYGYDELERLTRKSFPDPGQEVAYTYDTCPQGTGRLCTRTDASGQTDFTYDAYGNVTETTHTELGVTYTTAYGYDAGDRIVQMRYPSGRVVDITRDTLGRVQSMSATVNGAAQSILANLQYRGDGQILQRTFGNGLSDTRSYDLQGRLTAQGLGNLEARTYSYDPNGNLLSKTSANDPRAYGYDALDRLSVDTGPQTTAWAYDPNGNRRTETQPDQNALYRYGANTNRLEIIERTAPTGQTLTPRTSQSYTYNDANRRFQVFEGADLKATYVYNDQGQRTRKTTPTQTTVYHYDLQGNLIGESTDTGTSLRDYLWLNQEPTAQIDIAAIESVTYLHTDHLATPRLGTDQNQQVTWRWEGKAFGETQPAVETTKVNLRFPGQYFDEETKLHYNWNRYYDAGIGRYVTSDPIGLNSGINTFIYALNNPRVLYDSTGAKPTSPGRTIQPILRRIPIPRVPNSITGSLSGLEDAINSLNQTVCNNLKAGARLREIRTKLMDRRNSLGECEKIYYQIFFSVMACEPLQVGFWPNFLQYTTVKLCGRRSRARR